MRISDWSSDVCSSDLGFNCVSRHIVHHVEQGEASVVHIFLHASETKTFHSRLASRLDPGSEFPQNGDLRVSSSAILIPRGPPWESCPQAVRKIVRSTGAAQSSPRCPAWRRPVAG